MVRMFLCEVTGRRSQPEGVSALFAGRFPFLSNKRRIGLGATVRGLWINLRIAVPASR
jgi:hypothetical protein